MTLPPPSERVFVCGVTGSGKTQFIRHAFLPRARRLMIVDQTGEWSEKEGPAALVAFGFEETAKLLEECARKDSWRVLVYLEPEELEELTIKLLVPVPNPRAGYSANVGGMAILLDEVDILTPNGFAPIKLRHLWRRGRHVGLSIYAATQRPGNVSKEVTAQCRWIAILRQHEARDVEYLRSIIGRNIVDRVLPTVNREPYSVFLWDTQNRTGYILDRYLKERARVRAEAADIS